MKQNKEPMLFEAIGNIPNEYITEAANAETAGENTRQNKRKLRFVSIVSACLALLLLFPTIALIAHYSDPFVRYSNHPYFAVIASLMEKNEETAYLEKLERGNFWERLDDYLLQKAQDRPTFSGPGGLVSFGEASSGNRPSGNKAPTTTAPSEITDNQVEGVLEADIIKRTEAHIFYLHNMHLKIYTIEKEDSRLVCDIDLSPVYHDAAAFAYEISNFYLDEESILLEGFVHIDGQVSIKLARLSIEDCFDGKIDEIPATAMMQGSLLSTRLVGNSLLVLSRFAEEDEIRVSDENYLPHYKSGEVFVAVAPDKITTPEKPSDAIYTVAYLLDADTLAVKDSHALLGTPSTQYVSKNAIYLVSETDNLLYEGDAVAEFEENDRKSVKSRTTSFIEAVKYTDEGFESLGGVSVDGIIKDQYSLDEYENTLRVVTTTSERSYCLNENGSKISSTVTETNAALYIVSLADYSILSSANKFAPKNETVQSVRFDRTLAYVCTADTRSFTDPVYRFDLSDPKKITSLDTGTIDGYSTSLVELNNGDLLGIGYGKDRTAFKLEIYRKSENKLISQASFEAEWAEFSEDYKSYYINREENLFGVPIYLKRYKIDGVTHHEENACYILFSYDGESLQIKEWVYLGNTASDVDCARGFVLDGYLYVVNPFNLFVRLLNDTETES